MEFKSKKVLLVGWGAENEKDVFLYQVWYLTLKKIFQNLKVFDTKKNYFQEGKEILNKRLLEYIRKEEPDLVVFIFENDEIFPETLKKIREENKNTKLLVTISDDDARFDCFSRYFGQFFDHILTSQNYVKHYKKDGLKNITFHLDFNTHHMLPMKIEKKYDITFIGKPKANREKILKYLIDNKINLRLFGWGWNHYPEFGDIYEGPISQEDYSKIINQSKINLSLTKAGYSEEKNHFNIKGRFFENALCKSFQIIEYFPEIKKLFKENKEVVLFKSKEELVKKIKYYLKNGKEREKIAANSYNRALKDYNREKQLRKIFKELFNQKRETRTFSFKDRKIKIIQSQDISKSKDFLKKKLKKIDYVSFSKNPIKTSKLKDYFQIDSLEKTKKDVSCCDYYLTSTGIEDYMLFTSKFAFKRIGKRANNFIDINQLMMRKTFFLDNLEKIKKLFINDKTNLLDEKNTTFVSIPLISIKRNIKGDSEDIKKSFEIKFMDKIFSLIYQKKIFFSKYFYHLIIFGFKESFILKHIIESVFNKDNWDKLAINKIYTPNTLRKLLKEI